MNTIAKSIAKASMGIALISFLVTSCTKDSTPLNDQSTIATPTDRTATVLQVHGMVSEHTSEFTEKDIEKLLGSALQQKTGSCVAFTSTDLSGFLGCYGQSGLANPCNCYDFDGNGAVQSSDLTTLLSYYGNSLADFSDLDIELGWFNYNQHIYNPTWGLDLEANVHGSSGCSWNDIKANCCVEWFYDGILISTNKDELVVLQTLAEFGAFACDKYQYITVRVTHDPTGKVFERTNCGFYNTGNGEVVCSFVGCDESTYEIGVFSAPYVPYAYCTNC